MGWLRGALVVVELTLAVVLLSGAGLFLNTLLRVYHAPLAVDITNRLSIRLPLSAQRYPPEVLDAIGRSYYVSQSVPMGAN